MPFTPFNPTQEIQRTRRHLPHWHQEGRTYFVTFRLADSMPVDQRARLEAARDVWLHSKGINSLDEIEQLPDDERKEYHRVFTARIHELLDAGYGSCVLRTQENAEIVASSLLFFDGERYEMLSFVVMPNHVHLLVSPIEQHTLSGLLKSWKRHSARQINLRIGSTGTSLWLDENFDHIVRSSAQLDHFRNYLRDNPNKAGLPPGTFIHYDRKDAQESGTDLQSVAGQCQSNNLQ